MMARNERGGWRSTEGEGRTGMKDHDGPKRQHAKGAGEKGGDEDREPGSPPAGAWAAEQKAPENSLRDEGGQGRDGQQRVAGVGGGLPDTHDLSGSVGLSLTTIAWFLFFTIMMSEELPVGEYTVLAGLGYVSLFVLGFLLGRREPTADSDRMWVQVGFGCRMTVLLIMAGFMLHSLVGVGDEPWGGWEPPTLWIPAILLPALAVGGGFDGELLGEIARGLARRTPWHAVGFIVSERRRGAAGRNRLDRRTP